MRRYATHQDIAKAMGISRQAAAKKMKRIGARPLFKKGPTGNEKHYIASFLPEEYRVALAAMDSAPIISDPISFEERVGADAAREMLAEKAKAKMREQIKHEESLAAFEQLPEKRQREAEARYSLLKMCNSFVERAGFTIRRYALRSKVGDQAFVEAYNSGKIQIDEQIREIVGETTSYSTIRRIAETHYKYGIAGLAFGYHNPKRGSTALTDEQQDYVLAVACQNPETSSKNIRRALQGRFGQDVPSCGVIGRYLKNWIKENQELWLFYTNPDEWKNSKMFAFGSASEHVERLNQLWEADSTPADLMLADGRHSLIGMIDVYSRRLRFLVSKTSKATAVVGLIRHCLIEWGVPEVIKTDNGKDYVSNHVTRVIDGLGVEQQLCTPFQGQEKPHIERAFKTFLHGLVELMPGYIGHNIPQRKAIEARRSFAERVMNKESEPVEVNMSSEELQKFCNEWVNFVYHQDIHSSLDGKKPIEMVRNWHEPIRRINNMRALDMLLVPAAGTRTIGKKGVRAENRLFSSPDLAGHVGEEAQVLLDPVDLGTAYVYLVDDHGEKRFLTAAIDPEWAGIDRAKFAVSARKHQDKIMRAGRAELRKLSREQSTQNAYEEYLNMRREQVDNVVEFPTLGVNYDTPALIEAEKAVDAVENLKRDDESFEELIVELEAEQETTALNRNDKVVLLRTDADLYEKIRMELKQNQRALNRTEYEFLNKYYQTTSGQMYLSLEGDMRKKYGVDEQAQAKA